MNDVKSCKRHINFVKGMKRMNSATEKAWHVKSGLIG